MSKQNKTIAALNWSQRFALIDEAKVSAEDASKAFNVSADELKSIRKRVKVVDASIDTNKYRSEFKAAIESDTQPKKTRGPNSNHVKNAFIAVTGEPMPLDEFIKLHNISMHVMHQRKRFTTNKETGQPLPEFEGRDIRVRTVNGVKTIWDESLKAGAKSSDNG